MSALRSAENSCSTTARRRNDHVVALLVELDDLELEGLAFEVGGVAHRTDIDERTRQERADVVDLDGEATLHAARDGAGDDFGFVERLFEARPGAGTLGFFAREARFTGAVFHRVERDFDAVAGLDLDFAALVLELFERDDRFGLEADVDDDHVVADVDDEAREDHSGADTLVSDALFEELGKTFSHLISIRTVPRLEEGAVTSLTLAGNPVPSRHDEHNPASVRSNQKTFPMNASGQSLRSRPSERTRSTTASILNPVESSSCASGAGLSGAT